jgi:hypothetical protein
MALAIHLPHLTLNTDGERHPLENSLTLAAAVLAAVALSCAWVTSLHVVASWAGIAGTAIGLRAQLVSATRGERGVNVVAIGAAAVGMAFGLHNGGLY